MHRPSTPADLAPLGQVWARATLLYLFDGGHEIRLGQDLLECPEGGGGSYWWRLQRFSGDRAVFVGQDADGSAGHLLADPVDFLAGGPGWLPWEYLREEAESATIGYLYWWQDGCWDRAPYPEEMVDDGVRMSAPWVGDFGGPLSDTFDTGPWTREAEAAVGVFLKRAAARTVDGAVLRRLAEAAPEGGVLDPRDAVAAARRAGLMDGV